jgi:hypothetical protein
MSPELVFWLALATKMAITALFASVATIIAERLGAAGGGTRGDAAGLGWTCLRFFGA